MPTLRVKVITLYGDEGGGRELVLALDVQVYVDIPEGICVCVWSVYVCMCGVCVCVMYVVCVFGSVQDL